MFKLCASVLLGLCVAAPAQAGLFSDDDARKLSQDNRKEIQQLEARLLKLENRIDQQMKSMLDLQSQIETLNSEIRKLRRQNEELVHGLGDAEKRAKDFYVAVGYSLIFGVMGLLHFAHGEVFMVGAFIALQMVLLSHVSLPIATLGAMTATAILGIIIASIAFLPIKKQYVAAPLIATIGLGIIMQNLAVKIFGADQVSFPETIEIVNYKIGGVIINSLQIIILCVTLVLMILLSLYIKNTKIGKAMRASAERPTTASLLGVNYRKVVLVTFMIASALAGVAGVLTGLVYSSMRRLRSTPSRRGARGPFRAQGAR